MNILDSSVQEYNGSMPCVATPSRRPISIAATLSTLLAIAGAGCTVGPDFHPPSAPASSRFTEAPLAARTVGAAMAGGESQALGSDRDIPGEWWDLFHSPQISSLVTQALRANPDVAAAQASLRQARETTRAEQGSLFPSVNANVQAERQRESLAGFGFGNASTTFTTYGASLNV